MTSTQEAFAWRRLARRVTVLAILAPSLSGCWETLLDNMVPQLIIDASLGALGIVRDVAKSQAKPPSGPPPLPPHLESLGGAAMGFGPDAPKSGYSAGGGRFGIDWNSSVAASHELIRLHRARYK